MRGATWRNACAKTVLVISIHAPHAGRDLYFFHAVSFPVHFNPRAPCGARPHFAGYNILPVIISIHAPHAGRDQMSYSPLRASRYFNPRAPCGARLSSADTIHFISDFNPRAPCGARRPSYSQRCVDQNFNPRAPCGARLPVVKLFWRLNKFQSTRPMRGATCSPVPRLCPDYISIHAPHAGRDSKSIQNYFTHFCDKRQFLDNFTQNAAF